MTTTNFLGIPIEGEIDTGRRSPKEQKTKEELGEILRPLLEHPLVEGIRWRQYTPYFNDGDVCEFGVDDPQFKIQGLPEDAGDWEDGFVEYYDSALNSIIGTYHYEGQYPDRRQVHDGNGDAELFALVVAAGAIADGSFYDVLLGTFGDHAEVTVTADKIAVESYEHD